MNDPRKKNQEDEKDGWDKNTIEDEKNMPNNNNFNNDTTAAQDPRKRATNNSSSNTNQVQQESECLDDKVKASSNAQPNNQTQQFPG